jgi:DNA-3-methyladenine glycosylase II
MKDERMQVHDLPFSTDFKLGAIPPYHFLLTVRKPAGWSFLTPNEVFENSVLWSAMRLSSGEMYGLKLKSVGTVEKPEIFCKIFSVKKIDHNEKKQLLSMISWMLSLEEDIKPFYALAKHDSLAKALRDDLYGMRRAKRPDVFPQLILAVTLQMAPIARSDQMMTLLIDEYGEKVRFDNKEILYWPSPEKIAKVDVTELKEKCKLGYRAPVLKGIAEALCQSFPTLQELESMPVQEAKEKLMELKGIGEYSADIVSPHPGFAVDVWSAKIFNLLLFGSEPKSPRTVIPKLKKIAEKRWGRWRGYVFTYVLNDIPSLSKRFKLNLEEL